MGVRLLAPYLPDEEVLNSAPVVGGQWYRIAQYHIPDAALQSQVAAEISLSDGNDYRNDFIRLRASVAYNDRNASLLLAEYTCWDQPSFARVRLINLERGGSALEIWGEHPASATMRLRLRHEDFWPGLRWTPVNFAPVPETPEDGTILTRRGIAPTGGWITPVLVNSWVNFDSGFAPVGFRMHPGSLVEVRGLMKSGSMNAVAFTLPAGYRPDHRLLFPAVGGDNGTARCDVAPDGSVVPITGSNAYLTLDAIRFTAMQ
jgi:hypothetical protein